MSLVLDDMDAHCLAAIEENSTINTRPEWKNLVDWVNKHDELRDGCWGVARDVIPSNELRRKFKVLAGVMLSQDNILKNVFLEVRIGFFWGFPR